MKKFVFALLSLTLLIAACTVASFAGFFNTDVGDVDCNGDIAMGDVLLMRKYIAGIEVESTVTDTDAADIDADADITMADVLLLRKGIAGIIDIAEDYGNAGAVTRIARLMICSYKIDDYSILIPENPGDNVRVFSEKLADYIEEVTEVRVPVTSDTSVFPVIEIKPDFEEEYDLGDEGYIINGEEDGRLQIIGGEARGCMYGILDFVDNYLDVDFHQNGVSYNTWTRVTVETGTYDIWRPLFSYRCVRVGGYSNGSSNLETYVIPNKTNAFETNKDMERARYGSGLGRTYANAHSFDVYCEGIDGTNQPCLTDTARMDECTEGILALIEQRVSWGYIVGNNIVQISCSLMDNTNYCYCSSCKELANKEGSMAGPLIRFVNNVAIRVKPYYPEIDIFTIAYNVTRIPPKYAKPVDNVIICYCWNGCNNHTFGSGECDTPSHYEIDYNNNNDEEWFLGWASMTDKLYCWYYSTTFIYNMAPSPNVFNMYDDIRWLYDNGASGVFVEGNGGSTFEGLKGYLAAKMEENPLMTYEEYIDDMQYYLEYTYGAGWKYIFEYINMQTAAGDGVGCFVNNFEMPFDSYSRDYMAAHYEEMEALFNKAYDAAETSTQRANVRKASVHMYFLSLSARYESDYVNGTAEQRSKWKNDYVKKLYRYAKDYGVRTGVGSLPSTSEITGSPMKMWYDLDTGSRGLR